MFGGAAAAVKRAPGGRPTVEEAVLASAAGLGAAGASVGALHGLHAPVRDDLAAVDRIVADRMRSPVGLIPQLAGHIVASGGKRLRPLVTLLSARCCGYAGARHVALAACVEFIHTATLLHDDVVDASALRRGAPAANAVWGNQASVLVGDFLFSRAFELMVEDGSLEVLGILSRASAAIAEGEVMQLLTANDTASGEADCLKVAEAKTARLFAAAAEVGAVVAGSGAEERAALSAYGENLGVAFQLADDALDYASADETLGKRVGDDFREGKITMPVALAFARGGEDERRFWRRTLEDGRVRDGDLERAVEFIARGGAFDETLARARGYAERARSALAALPAGRYREALAAAAAFAAERAW